MKRSLYTVVSIAGLLFAWWIFSLILEVVRGVAIIPNPWQALVEVARNADEISRHLSASAIRLVTSMVIAFLAAVPLGLIIGHERRFDRLATPLIYITYPIPQVVFLPVLFIIFGLGDAVRITVISLALFFQILISARGAAKGITREDLVSALSAGAGRFQVYRHVVLPASLPAILTSMRVSIGLGMALLFLSETAPLRTLRGLGSFIAEHLAFRRDIAFAGVVAMAFLGLILYILLDVIERIVCRWRYVKRRDRSQWPSRLKPAKIKEWISKKFSSS
ncbi:ABC transporter permease subunit [Candidatus Bipolaricaulota bacterium]|nr:ABC transporter permease subunit [Candidatus Bipolaricaulota bacterium]HBR09824.1 ABC transporter permease [Candidatus Acetothermia bacterium]